MFLKALVSLSLHLLLSSSSEKGFVSQRFKNGLSSGSCPCLVDPYFCYWLKCCLSPKLQIRNVETNQCVDNMGRKENEKVGFFNCHGMGGNQVSNEGFPHFHFTNA